MNKIEGMDQSTTESALGHAPVGFTMILRVCTSIKQCGFDACWTTIN